ncbi:stage II sporulation protein E [Ruminiclostridium sufflavum DSM 19573]|uniref:Stage II sporulation protein E n=1 Tax=Ruminiclostridium sufflavum DSM 19573 TaxID=1121337 RepID=A0A318XNB9_9FIRM|nr:stage II sporulation protein E [Ruminiclostridium sufflavum]PYG88216.1 stage II sporulation protein E [Ruminiclostridium sufflavum DSM 19573]
MKTETLPYKNIGGYNSADRKKTSGSKIMALLQYLNKTNFFILPMAFLLGRITLFDGRMPFGIAIYAATLGMNINRIFISIAIFAGMLTTGSAYESELFYKLLTASTVMLLINAINIPFKKSMGSHLRIGIITFLGLLIPETVFIYLEGFYMYSILEALLNGFIIFALVFVLKNVMEVLESPSKIYNMTNEEILSIAIACALAVSGLGPCNIYGISLRNIFCIIIILIFSFKTGAGNGTAIGVIVGTLISISSESSAAIASYAFCGLISGILRSMGKIGCCMGVLMGDAILTYVITGSIEVLILYEIVISVAIFMLIPEKAMDAMVSRFDRKLLAKGDKKGYSARIKEITVEKLNRFSAAFGEMAKTFDEISETKTITEKHDITAIFDRVADKVCKDCSLCTHCWEQNFCNTYQVMFKIVEKLDSKGWIEQEDIPRYFMDRCERVDEFVKAVNNVFELFKVDMVWRSRIGESRGLVSQQLKSMSKVISNLAGELNVDIDFKDDIENQIILDLSKAGIRNAEAIVYENKFGKYEVRLTYKGCGGRRACIGNVEKAVSEVIGRRMLKDGSECGLNSKSNMCTINLVEEETFKVITGVARIPKNEKYVSGDNYTFINTGDGKYIAALSDGMGTGHKACVQSKATVNLIEQFMESGFDKDTTVKLINSLLVLRSNDDSFATIDMSVVDLYEGEVEFVKVGAAPTFIKRSEVVETVKTASLPAGILSEVELELVHKKVNNGDFVIMVSDGIIDSFQNTPDSVKEVQGILERMTSKNPQAIADDLLEEALCACKDKAPVDDMMVMVAKVWKSK